MTDASRGRFVADLYGCDLDLLENPKVIEAALREAARRLGASRQESEGVVYRFHPQGISAAVVSRQVTLLLHSWPEDHASATLDIYCYERGADPATVVRDLVRALGANADFTFREGFAAPTA
jgi:S-adenosylmethionine decarboxylase